MLRLGGNRTVEEWQEAMSSREFLRWLFVFKKMDEEDLGRTEKIDYYLAQIAMYVVAAAGGKKIKLSDFILKFGSKAARARKNKRQTWQEQKALLTAAFVRMGGNKPADFGRRPDGGGTRTRNAGRTDHRKLGRLLRRNQKSSKIS